MDISVKDLEEAVSIRRQIDKLQKRLASILGDAPPKPKGSLQVGRSFSPATRAKLSAAAKARWAKLGGTTGSGPARKRSSRLMKAHWVGTSDTVPPPKKR